MISFLHKRMGNQKGFTLIELMIVVAIIGILTAIAFPLYANVQQRARIAKAQADVRTLASAIVIYSAHTGLIPTTGLAGLSVLTVSTAANGVTAGPFMGSIPSPPSGGSPAWGAYTYTTGATGQFTVSTTGDGVTAMVP
jgi:type II secretion system protein G